jgi:D-threo-aldose 1-dehydrogenase
VQPELPKHLLGQTGLEVTPICAGGAPLASIPQNFGYEVPAERAYATLDAIFDSPINFLDSSNSYGHGESEKRIGAVIGERGGLPAGFVLATKADRDPVTGDFSGARVRRSAEESLERLGLERFTLFYLHDPEHISFAEAVAPGGPVEEMVKLRESGLALHLGVAGGPVEFMADFLALGVFEVLLTHNRFTLVDRSSERLLSLASNQGVGVVNGAPFGGGLLARGTSYTNRYAYQPASAATLKSVAAMEDVCGRYGVTLRAAALQFSLREDRICSTVVGTASPEHVVELVATASAELPAPLFEELASLCPPQSEWLW